MNASSPRILAGSACAGEGPHRLQGNTTDVAVGEHLDRQSWLGWLDLGVTAVAAPFLVFPGAWTPAAAVTLVAMWVLRLRLSGRLTRRTPVDWPLAVLMIMTLVAVAISVDPAVSLNKFWGIVLGVAIFYSIVNGVSSAARTWAVVAVLAAVGTAVALAALGGTNFPESKIVDLSFVYRRLPILFYDVPGSGIPKFGDGSTNIGNRLFSANEVGGTLAMLLPLPIAAAVFLSGWRKRLLLAPPILLMVGTLMLTQSWSAGWGLVGAMACLGAWQAPRRLLIPALLASPLLLLTAVVAVSQVLPRLAETTFSRLDVWQQSLTMLWDMPFTGIGLNTFPFIRDRFYPGFSTTVNLPHAHNLFLQTGLDLGIPGLLAFVTMLVLVGKAAYGTYGALPTFDQIVMVGAAAGVIAYLTFGLTDAITLGAKPGAVFWALLGLMMSRCPEDHRLLKRSPQLGHST